MKRLVLCFDGTWNSADSGGADTSVALIARAVRATTDTGGVLQSVLYLRGVGTAGLDSQIVIEGATGLGVDDNIRSGYMFLAQNYVPGDEIFLFGFSRGAFTARSLAGFISACGLLKRQKLADLGRAWNYYRGPGPHSAEDFTQSCTTDCHIDVEIKFLGVWDTVGAMGVPSHLFAGINHDLFAFHDTSPCRLVRHGCHALAIDEHRDEFVPTLWTGEIPKGAKIEQVWFAGAHSDVGGGYITRKLADIPLVWMARKAEQDGLVLDWSCLPDPKALSREAPSHDSRTLLYAKDRIVPTFRQVCAQAFQVPFYQRLYAPTDGSGRPLPTINEAVHQSVLDRYGTRASNCTSDAHGTCTNDLYRPANVAALFDGDGKLKLQVKVEPY